MKASVTNKVRIVILVIFAILAVQTIMVLLTINGQEDVRQIKTDVQSIVYLFLFGLSLVLLIMYFYLPLYFKRSFQDIHRLLKTIAEGKYNQEIDLMAYDQDREFLEIIKSIQMMLTVVRRFDQLKTEKIFEQHSRIHAVLNMTEDGFIIVNTHGDIAYINDPVRKLFPVMVENSNLHETSYPGEVEKTIKTYILKVLRTQSKAKDIHVSIPSLRKELSFMNAIVRDSSGEAIGAVFSVKEVN